MHDITFCINSCENKRALLSQNGMAWLTFDCDVYSLLDEQLQLYEHTTDVRPLVHPLLDISKFQGAVFKHHLQSVTSVRAKQLKLALPFLI